MSFQKPTQYDNPPKLQHSKMVKEGRPLLVQVANVRWVKNNTLFLAELLLDKVKHVYFTSNADIAQGFTDHVGKQVVITASGNDKMGTASMEFQIAGKPASELFEVTVSAQPESRWQTVATSGPSEPQKPVGQAIKNPEPSDREAKAFLCQAANLMRLCIKKANDIAVELDLPPEHRQGIGTTLFIQSDRMGYINKMPIQPYTPEQLGWGASKADSLETPQPEDDE